jgi:outer membrane biosynthesis protein TonB
MNQQIWEPLRKQRHLGAASVIALVCVACLSDVPQKRHHGPASANTCSAHLIAVPDMSSEGTLGSGASSEHPLPTIPKIRMGATTVSGRLPPEVIQRIVRQAYGRFRTCYQEGLSRNPNLEGRVSVRFLNGRDGSVSSVSNGSSDLLDAQTVNCIISAYCGLHFPPPKGGIVTVVYPVTFESGAESGAGQ